jgi:hypothetical protein
MLPLNDSPLRFRPENLTRYDSAARSAKNAPIMVFFCPVTGSALLTIPVFCGIRPPPGMGLDPRAKPHRVEPRTD